MQIECGWCSYCSSFCNFENWCFWNAHWLIILKVVTIIEVHLSRFVQVINWTLFQWQDMFGYGLGPWCILSWPRAWETCSDHNWALGNLHGLQKEDIIPLWMEMLAFLWQVPPNWGKPNLFHFLSAASVQCKLGYGGMKSKRVNTWWSSKWDRVEHQVVFHVLFWMRMDTPHVIPAFKGPTRNLYSETAWTFGLPA